MLRLSICLFALFFIQTAIAQKKIFEIARSGSIEELEQLVSSDPDVINYKNEAGYSPLILACYHGNNDVAKYLIKNMKDINGSSDYGTPLMAAVVKNNVDLVSMLLKKNADPNISDGNGTTALLYAVMFQYEEIVKLLSQVRTINLDHKDNKGFTAFDYAVKLKNEPIIKTLKLKK